MLGRCTYDQLVQIRAVSDSPMTGEVDLDQLLHTVRRRFKDREVVPNARIVDQDRWALELGADLSCGRIDRIGVGDIALDVQRDDWVQRAWVLTTHHSSTFPAEEPCLALQS